jgi:phosphoglycerate dehydrogenase-like enzyme
MAGGKAMKIAILDDYHHHAAEYCDWGDLRAEVTIFHAPIPAETLAETLAPFDVICAMRERTPLDAALIGALPNLRLIVTTGLKNAAIDMAAAAARGIPVCGTPTRLEGTSQLAMMLMLNAMRGFQREADTLRGGGWQAVGAGRDLHGLTLGLIGLGRQGAGLAALARPFGMRLIAWSANLTDDRCAEVGGVERMPSLDALLAEADVASIHLILSARSRGLLGARELGLMKRDALLVNTSRGPIVDEAALLAALRKGTGPGMAALDVYDAEPLPAASPLRDAGLIANGRLLLSPHLGYATRQGYALMYRETASAVRAWAAGNPVMVLA